MKTSLIPADIFRSIRIDDGKSFQLADHAPDAKFSLAVEKDAAKQSLSERIERLASLQDKLYADNRFALLLIFQAMDAAGKDGAIKAVTAGLNPQGCQVFAFKAPSAEELDHDFLWRTTCRMPERGRIGVFNRSYYEEVLVVRVHPEILQKQALAPGAEHDDLWNSRFKSIRTFEKHMARNGTRILKFFLNVSKKEQKKRLLERIDDPQKNWKFEAGDVDERGRWKDYMHAYEEMIRHTASEDAPWYCIPADDKWLARVLIQETAIAELETLPLAYPTLSGTAVAGLATQRARLVAD